MPLARRRPGETLTKLICRQTAQQDTPGRRGGERRQRMIVAMID